MATANDRLKRNLDRANQRDILEQKLGISGAMTKIRDERAFRSVERAERESSREKLRDRRH